MTTLNSVRNSAIVLVGTASTLFIANLVSKYGVEGTLRYIWEGGKINLNVFTFSGKMIFGPYETKIYFHTF